MKTKNAHCYLYDAANWAYIAMQGGLQTAHMMPDADTLANNALAHSAKPGPESQLTEQDRDLRRALVSFANWRKTGTQYSNQDFDVQQALLSAMDYRESALERDRAERNCDAVA